MFVYITTFSLTVVAENLFQKFFLFAFWFFIPFSLSSSSSSSNTSSSLFYLLYLGYFFSSSLSFLSYHHFLRLFFSVSLFSGFGGPLSSFSSCTPALLLLLVRPTPQLYFSSSSLLAHLILHFLLLHIPLSTALPLLMLFQFSSPSTLSSPPLLPYLGLFSS